MRAKFLRLNATSLRGVKLLQVFKFCSKLCSATELLQINSRKQIIIIPLKLIKLTGIVTTFAVTIAIGAAAACCGFLVGQTSYKLFVS